MLQIDVFCPVKTASYYSIPEKSFLYSKWLQRFFSYVSGFLHFSYASPVSQRGLGDLLKEVSSFLYKGDTHLSPLPKKT
jgi:hypothetical protein